MNSSTDNVKRIAFFGTPQIAATILQSLLSVNDWTIPAVITQPDKPRGRGQQLQPSEVKVLANAQGIPVFQPTTLRQDSADMELQRLRSFLTNSAPFDAFIVVAYGKLVPKWLYSWPNRGSINVHCSLLPRWRGAAPIHHALLAGDTETGVCLMQIEEELDSGPVFTKRALAIEPEDSMGTLYEKLAEAGAQLLVASLPAILNGAIDPVPQSTSGITFAPKWERKDAVLNLEEDVLTIARRIRACSPTPGLRATLNGEEVKILRARVETSPKQNLGFNLGTIVDVSRESIKVIVTGGILCIEQMQFPGKRPLDVREILKGRSIASGSVLAGPKNLGKVS